MGASLLPDFSKGTTFGAWKVDPSNIEIFSDQIFRGKWYRLKKLENYWALYLIDHRVIWARGSKKQLRCWAGTLSMSKTIRWSEPSRYRKLFGCWAGSLSKSRVCLRVFLICGQRVDCKRSLCTPTDLGSKNNISSRGILTTRFLRKFLSQDFLN